MYTPQTSSLERTSVHIKSMCINKLCSHKALDFSTPFGCEHVLGITEKRASGVEYDYRGRSQDFSKGGGVTFCQSEGTH